MTRVTEILPAGSWPAADAADVFAADYEGRHRRRMMLPLRSGAKVLLELGHARLLHEGDGLRLDDGRIVRVEAMPEDLMEVTAHDALHLLRLAWHLGNRHLPAAIGERCILVRHDHVIADMIHGLGGHVRTVRAPFDPESGAYAGRAGAHAHSHDHGDGHHHSHD
ncbi:urease accessory protein UreE [Komagataeibacter swingsii]|uniref:Urease accessory protein UreE n=1 Tax=Komagataeibacter swingsii TaxID=215220 RepID=A0A2V4R7W6_9PROT|nr:urease accessory protein UreE [Komagataeibacter swingsii]PYD68280.1 urease accessory protein UreE [Komagataeibacter swingsii]GBQ56223.1 urease accessory protein UreE [Komagataeibacter swingsii DSM 16373]